MDTGELERTAIDIREAVLDMVYTAKSGHIGGDLSAADIMTALFFFQMEIDPENPEKEDRDRFILSKGHSAEVYYACLALRGFFPLEELKTYCKPESRLLGHPTNKVPGIDVNTGALGHGLAIATGMAIGLKKKKINRHVYVLMGDGEQAEGSVWEALMAASNYKLDNLTAIIDRNHLQISGNTEDVMKLESLKEKYTAFGWETIVIDGNSMDEVLSALSLSHPGKPKMIIANTIKGKGIREMENVASWHHGIPDAALYSRAKEEIQYMRRMYNV